MTTSAPRRTVDIIDRRVGLLFGVFVLLLLVAVARAGYLGLFRGSALRAAATSQQVRRAPIPARAERSPIATGSCSRSASRPMRSTSIRS